MKQNEKNPKSILQRLADMELELREIRQYLAETMNDAAHQTTTNRNFNISYSLDDLYNAFGYSKKHYASRLRNALQKKGVTTLSEFLALTPGQLLDLENVSVGTLEQTKKALDRLGVSW